MYRPYVAKSDPDPVKKKRSGSATLVSPSPKYWDYIQKKEIKLPFCVCTVFDSLQRWFLLMFAPWDLLISVCVLLFIYPRSCCWRWGVIYLWIVKEGLGTNGSQNRGGSAVRTINMNRADFYVQYCSDSVTTHVECTRTNILNYQFPCMGSN